MTKNTKVTEALSKLEKALERLEEALQNSLEDKLTVDATIQRFEFCIELFWKFLQRVLETKAVIAPFPKTVFQKSYAGGLIDDEKKWLKMIDDRNMSSHTYDQVLAIELYHRIENHYLTMKSSLETIKKSGILD